MLPVLNSPILMAQSKVQPCPPMMVGKERAFLLHHSLHTSFLQVVVNCLRGDGTVLHILECFDDLDCIFSLPRPNKTNGMAHINRRNDGRTTTRGFGWVGKMFGVQPADRRLV